MSNASSLSSYWKRPACKKQLAAMIDKTPISVNRWASEGKTSVEPPLMVLQFLRAYVTLPEPKRAILRGDHVEAD